MYYAKQTNDGFHITVLKVLFPATSFPDTGPDASWLADSGVYPVEEHLYFDANAYKRNGIDPTLRDGTVYTAELVALTDEDKAQREADRLAQLASVAREQRNRLLAGCDWTQLADYTRADKADWTAYRKALRDVTKQADFPESIVWPTAPGV
jgi:hypothetical protein